MVQHHCCGKQRLCNNSSKLLLPYHHSSTVDTPQADLRLCVLPDTGKQIALPCALQLQPHAGHALVNDRLGYLKCRGTKERMDGESEGLRCQVTRLELTIKAETAKCKVLQVSLALSCPAGTSYCG